MAKHKHEDFARLCGIHKASLSSYKSRGKVVKGDDGLFDDQVEPNASFLKKRLKKLIKNIDEGGETSNIGEGSLSGVPLHEVERRLKVLDTQKRAEEVELLRKKNAKMDGETVPTELVKPVFESFAREIGLAMKNGLEKLTMHYAKKYDLGKKATAEMRGDMAKVLTQSMREAEESAVSQMKSIVEQHSVTRGVGERE